MDDNISLPDHALLFHYIYQIMHHLRAVAKFHITNASNTFFALPFILLDPSIYLIVGLVNAIISSSGIFERSLVCIAYNTHITSLPASFLICFLTYSNDGVFDF
jgi:hypothetical protein